MNDSDEMIDLDELLNGNPTMEQVREFWNEGDFDSEQYVVQAIEKHLLTDEQRKLMFDCHLSIEKMLNGRYMSTPDNLDAVSKIYLEWNSKLGFVEFGQ